MPMLKTNCGERTSTVALKSGVQLITLTSEPGMSIISVRGMSSYVCMSISTIAAPAVHSVRLTSSTWAASLIGW